MNLSALGEFLVETTARISSVVSPARSTGRIRGMEVERRGCGMCHLSGPTKGVIAALVGRGSEFGGYLRCPRKGMSSSDHQRCVCSEGHDDVQPTGELAGGRAGRTAVSTVEWAALAVEPVPADFRTDEDVCMRLPIQAQGRFIE